MDKKINVYIYNESDGSLFEELEYNHLILALNKVIDNNIDNENKLNIICSESFPPFRMIYDKTKKTFITFKEVDKETKNQFVNMIKNVY